MEYPSAKPRVGKSKGGIIRKGMKRKITGTKRSSRRTSSHKASGY